jgi:hypothetical protein
MRLIKQGKSVQNFIIKWATRAVLVHNNERVLDKHTVHIRERN